MLMPIVQRRGGRQESKWVSILLLKISWKVPQPPSQYIPKPQDARTWAGLPILSSCNLIQQTSPLASIGSSLSH